MATIVSVVVVRVDEVGRTSWEGWVFWKVGQSARVRKVEQKLMLNTGNASLIGSLVDVS